MNSHLHLLFCFFTFLLPQFCLANDPCSAIPVPNNGVLFNTYNLNSQSGSGVEEPPCGTFNDPDIWFSFVAPAGGSVTIEIKGITATDPAMAIYSGACGAPTLVGCYDDQQCGNNANPGVSLTQLTVGATYYIRVWNEAPGGGTFKMRILNLNQSNFTNQFNAYNTGPNCVQLTAAAGTQKGCSWYNAPLDFDEPFELEFNLFFGNNDAGADGICLVFSTSQACGETGGGLGAQGIPNSVIIEFDTWDNGTAGYDDIPDDHTSIHVNGDFTSSVAGPVGLGNIEDGVSHSARILWDPTHMNFTVEFDGAPVMTLGNYDVIANCFNGQSEVFWGWTASTGGAFNQQSFCFESAVIDNTAAINEQLDIEICNGEVYTSPNGNTYNSDGTYTEEFTAVNGCNSIRTINLKLNPVQIKLVDKIICDGESYIINGTNYNIPGQYQVSVPGVPCDTIVELTLNKVDFDLYISKGNDIDCLNSSSLLQAQIIDQSSLPFNGIFEYEWTTNNGNIVSGQGTDQITIDKSGIYQLIIKAVGVQIDCYFTSDFIEVLDNSAPPVAIIAPQGELNCTSTQMILDGNASNPGPLLFNWSTTNGNIIGNNFGSVAVIDAEGNYQLIVENFISGCKDTTSFTVVKNSFNATAELNKSNNLNCRSTLSTISAAVLNGQGLDIEWSTVDGNITTNIDNDTIIADKAGTYVFTLSDDNGCTQSYSIVLDENKQLPSINAGVDVTLDCTVTGVTLTGAVVAPVSDYEIQWTSEGISIPDNDQLSIFAELPGTYVFTVTDTLNNCVSIDTIIVNESVDKPILTAVAHDIIRCNIPEIQLNVNISNYDPSFIFEWTALSGTYSGNSTDNTILAGLGSYDLKVTNPLNGCFTIINYLVEGSIDQPIADAGPDFELDCTTSSLSIQGLYNSSDPDNLLNFKWNTVGGTISGPTNLPGVNIIGAGIYIFEVENLINGCKDIDTIDITQSIDKPLIDIPGSYTLTCLDNTTSIIPNWSNAGSDPIVTWSTNDGTIDNVSFDSIAIVSAGGTYKIEVENAENGCSSVIEIMVTENKEIPLGSIPTPQLITCNILEVSLSFDSSTNNYDYLWSTTDGAIITPNSNASITVNKAGTYFVLVTDPVNGCSRTFEQVVNVSSDFPQVDAGSAGTLNCEIEELSLKGTVGNVNNYSISWQGINGGNILSGISTLQPLIDESGIYILTVVNLDNNCVTSDTVSVVKNITNPVLTGFEFNDANCFNKGGSISFTSIENGVGPYKINLNGDDVTESNFQFSNLSSGEYLIEGTDANGCPFDFEANIEAKDAISFILPDSVTVEFGQSYQLLPQFLFDTLNMTFEPWKGANYLDCNSCLYPTIFPTHDALLTLSVNDSDGCPAEESIQVRVFKRSSSAFVPNVFSPGDHNGINDFVTVFTDREVIKNIDEFRIFDRWGAEVFSKTNFLPNDEKEGWDGYYRGKMVNPAVYIYFAKFKNIYGEEIQIKGSVTLVQ